MYHIKKAENFTVFTMKRKYAQNLNKYVRFLHFTFFQSLIYSKIGFKILISYHTAKTYTFDNDY